MSIDTQSTAKLLPLSILKKLKFSFKKKHLYLYILLNAKKFFLSVGVCVCIIKLLCHFLPDLAQILNKAMNSKGAASKPVPGADFTRLLILRHLFVSHTQILADSQSDCEKVVEPKRNPNRTDFSGIQLSIQLGTKTG